MACTPRWRATAYCNGSAVMLVVATKSRTDPGAEVKGRHVMLRISLLAALALAVAVPAAAQDAVDDLFANPREVEDRNQTPPPRPVAWDFSTAPA